MNQQLNFGIVGCGRIALRHAELMQPYGSLKAVCDIVPAKADILSKRYGSKVYYSLDKLLTNENALDVLVVCTPNGLHAEHSIMALNAGMHVLCEKPMALTTSDCARMIEAANRNKKILFVVKQNRFNPPVRAVKELIASRRLGKIFSFQLNCFWNRNEDYYNDAWRGTKELDGGTLFTQFSHFIDLLYWFFGDVQEIQAITANLAHKGIIEFEDTGVVLMKFNNGILGCVNYSVNTYQKNMEGSLTILAEKGTVKIGGRYLNELEYQCIKNFEIPGLPTRNSANDYGTYTGSMSNHDKVYENLAGVLHNDSPMYVNADDGLKTVEIIERIYQSAKSYDDK